MNPTAMQADSGQAAGAVATPAANPALQSRLRMLARTIRQGYLQVFGIADYERYLTHHDLHHPERPLLSRQEFHAQAIDRKYCRSGARCC